MTIARERSKCEETGEEIRCGEGRTEIKNAEW